MDAGGRYVVIRPARFADIPGIVGLLVEGHARSRYANRCAIDIAEAKRLLLSGLQRVGGRHAGACLINVAVSGDAVLGLHYGVLTRVYEVGAVLMATDLLFYVSPAADPGDFRRLFDSFERWALSNREVIEIRPGVTDIIDDPERLAKFYERRGYRRSGVIFERSAGRQ